MKKRIFVCMPGAMELGGVERSLLGLLDAVDYAKYEVDLFLYGHHGSLMPYINSNIRILPEVRELAFLRESFKAKLRGGAWYSAWRRIADGLRHVGNDDSWAKVLRKCVPKQTGTYDIAISFFLPFDMIRDKVDAKVKLGWIHTDYSAHKISPDSIRRSYAGIDYRVAVSEACRDAFIQVLPEYSDSTIVIENILPQALIHQQAKAFDASAYMNQGDGIFLLSIGRYCHAKNFDNIPEICSKILANGLDVTWYIIGFGTDEAKIKEKIVEYGMEDHVILLGKQENPYPYITACDVYVQPSRYEGKCVAVREAQMLGKPVIITNYPTASSQLEDGVDGIVVPQDNHGCAEGICAVLRNLEFLAQMAENCKNRDYANSREIEKLYQYITQQEDR